MHVLFLHSYFCTEDAKANSRSYDLCRALLKKGHKVTVICQVIDTNKVIFEKSFGIFNEIILDDVKIIGINVPYSNKMGIARRLLSFSIFMIISSFKSLYIKDVDIVFGTSTPPTIAIPSLVVKFIRKVPFVFELRDIWPDFVEQLNVLPRIGKWLFPIVDVVMKKIYRCADFVTTTTPGMTKIIAKKGIDEKKLGTILLGANRKHFASKVQPHPILSSPILMKKFIIAYLGSISYGYGLSRLIEVAARVTSVNPNLSFLLLGRGNKFKEISNKINELGLTNVYIGDAINYREVPKVLQFVHIGYESSLPSRASDCALDNKFYDYISAGLPIISNYDGDMGDILRKNECGYVANNINDEVKILDRLEKDRNFLGFLSENARLLSRELDRDKQANLFVEKLEQVSGKRMCN